jgi:Peptidase A4 family
MRRRLAMATVGLALAFGTVGPAAAAVPTFHQTILAVNANQSNNWSGYNQGTLEKNDTLFNSITGNWVVPTATQHKSGEAEDSSTWIGIGGGCIDAGCTATDSTLIQTGTEQDVAANGKASYSAWWELVPAPSVTISGFAVHPGDTIHGDITEVVGDSDVWTITLKNVTTGASFSQTVPYPSTHTTAEWIEETPLEIGTSGTGLSAMPNLGTVTFTNATVNGAAANLAASEEMQLIDSNGNVIATPSAPNSAKTGFNDCVHATSCSAPSSAAKKKKHHK